MSDAEAAVTWLKAQPQIDPYHIGLLGHSEGGIIAPAVAAADKSVAFVVMIAGPTIRGDRLFVLQSAMTARLMARRTTISSDARSSIKNFMTQFSRHRRMRSRSTAPR
jgi:dienelactone hydrolase